MKRYSKANARLRQGSLVKRSAACLLIATVPGTSVTPQDSPRKGTSTGAKVGAVAAGDMVAYPSPIVVHIKRTSSPD